MAYQPSAAEFDRLKDPGPATRCLAMVDGVPLSTPSRAIHVNSDQPSVILAFVGGGTESFTLLAGVTYPFAILQADNITSDGILALF